MLVKAKLNVNCEFGNIGDEVIVDKDIIRRYGKDITLIEELKSPIKNANDNKPKNEGNKRNFQNKPIKNARNK